MNWFERYGIVGLYFIALNAGWLISFSFPSLRSISDFLNQKNASIIIAIGIAISLPIGYILSILSQNIYYILPKCMQIHRKVEKEIGVNIDYNECKIESFFAVRHRLSSSPNKLENLKWLQEFIRKRWDVLAISSSIIVATVLAPVLSFVYLSFLPWDPNCQMILILSSLSLIVIGILFWSRHLMLSQIVEVTKEALKEVL